MTESEIIKVTSKGQITIPSQFRKELSINKDTHLYATRAGKFLLLKKVEELSLEEISGILGSIAEAKGITRKELAEEAKKARREFLKKKNE